jgi:hypothetical protein
LRAVVLHSPILSGLRVLYPVKKTFWFDIYKVNFTPTFSLRIVVDKWLIHFPLFCRMSTKSAW